MSEPAGKQPMALVYVRDEHVYVFTWFCDCEESLKRLMRVFGKYAVDEELNFTSEDAGRCVKAARKLQQHWRKECDL